MKSSQRIVLSASLLVSALFLHVSLCFWHTGTIAGHHYLTGSQKLCGWVCAYNGVPLTHAALVGVAMPVIMVGIAIAILQASDQSPPAE